MNITTNILNEELADDFLKANGGTLSFFDIKSISNKINIKKCPICKEKNFAIKNSLNIIQRGYLEGAREKYWKRCQSEPSLYESTAHIENLCRKWEKEAKFNTQPTKHTCPASGINADSTIYGEDRYTAITNVVCTNCSYLLFFDLTTLIGKNHIVITHINIDLIHPTNYKTVIIDAEGLDVNLTTKLEKEHLTMEINIDLINPSNILLLNVEDATWAIRKK